MMLWISLVSALLAAASATILMRDDFTTDGNLVGSAPDVGGVWAFQTITFPDKQGSGAVTVSQGALNVSSALAEDVYSNLTAVVSTGSVYAGMDINHPTPSSLPIFHVGGSPTPLPFTHFNAFNQLFGICLVRVAVNTSTGYQLRLGQSWTAEMAYGTTYRLVYSFNTTDDLCSLWVNATSEASTRIMTDNPVERDSTISAVAFRQTNSTPPWTLSIRNLIVATTFAEAYFPPPHRDGRLPTRARRRPQILWARGRARSRLARRGRQHYGDRGCARPEDLSLIHISEPTRPY